MRGNMSHKISPPDGWTFVRRDSIKSALTKAIYIRTARSTEPSSYMFGFSKTQTVNGIILAFSGVDSLEPVAASAGTGTAKSASIHASEVSAPAAGGYLVGSFATSVKATVVPPAGRTERLDLTQSAARDYLTSEIATEVVGAGGTGSRTALATAASDNFGQLLVLRPAN